MTTAAAPLWPADKVERRAVADLVPYAQNARMHSEAQVDQLVASIREWGFTVPVLIDERGEIIAGHGRLLAADRLGLETVPAMVARGWTARQIKAYRLADNQLALNAAWDVKLLSAELGELAGLEHLIGFSADDLAALARGDGGADNLPTEEEARQTLAERFGLPPFSVLNAREGWWQERKRAWLALGIESELGRGENLLQYSETVLEPDPKKRAAKKANGKTAARTFGQDLMRGEHVVANNKKTLGAIPGDGQMRKQYTGKGGDLPGPAGPRKRAEKGAVVAGKGWAEGGPARRDAAFYAKKRAWEKANGQKISTTEFREKHWDGAQ